jgi:hypothetical protein
MTYNHPQIPLPETPEYQFNQSLLGFILLIVFMAWFVFLIWWFVRQIDKHR